MNSIDGSIDDLGAMLMKGNAIEEINDGMDGRIVINFLHGY